MQHAMVANSSYISKLSFMEDNEHKLRPNYYDSNIFPKKIN